MLLGLFAGTSASGQWRQYLLWSNGVPFGTQDVYFERDLGFYVFDLPWLHYVVDSAMAFAVVALMVAALVHYLYGGIQLQARHDRLSGAAQAHVSVLLGVFVLAKAVDYWLDRFDLVNDQNSLITGMTYTGENAVLPAKNILLGISVICAVLFFLNVWRRTWMLPSMGLALLVLSSILLGMIWPAIIQQFSVNPSEADKEAPYIEANIDATRAAYDVEDIEVEPFTSETARHRPHPRAAGDRDLDGAAGRPAGRQPDVRAGAAGPRLLLRRGPVLDVDRYEIDGTDRALVLGVRELDQDGISETDRNWTNLHTVYTHGNGVIAAYANQRDEYDTNGSQRGPVGTRASRATRTRWPAWTPTGTRTGSTSASRALTTRSSASPPRTPRASSSTSARPRRPTRAPRRPTTAPVVSASATSRRS